MKSSDSSQPGKRGHRKGTRVAYIRRAWKIDAKDCAGMLAAKVLAALSFSMETLLLAAFIDNIISYFQGEKPLNLWSAAGLLLLWVVNAMLPVAYQICREGLQNGLSHALSMQVLQKKRKIPYAHLEKQDVWELLERIREDPSPSFMAGFENLLSISQYIIQILGLLFVVASQHWSLAILVAILLWPYSILSMKNGEEEYTAYEESTRHFRKARYYTQTLSNRENAEERNLFGYQDWMNQKWSDEYDQAIALEKRSNAKVFGRSGMADVLSVLVVGAMALGFLWPLGKGWLTGGFYIATIKAVLNYVELLSLNLAPTMIAFEKAKHYLQDFLSFENLAEESERNCGPFLCPEIESIEFKDVSFSYPDDSRKILRHLSCKQERKKQYAFVGENGAGKTTIMKLLTGFYDDYTGEILINGRELRTVSKDQWQSLFSVVYQDYARYEISLAENLMPNQANPSPGAMEQMLEDVGLGELAKGWKNGLRTPLGRLEPDGVDLSTGQWQRVAIARGLLQTVPVHILDEPTASIDPVHEEQIYRLFQQLLKGQFAIYITHRLGAARMADEILVLQDGGVSERGSHDSLCKARGTYYTMYEEQKSWYEK